MCGDWATTGEGKTTVDQSEGVSAMAPTSTSPSLEASPHRRRGARVLGGCVALLAVFAASLTVAAPAEAATHARSKSERRISTAVLKLLNTERHAHHLPALRSNAHLKKSARRHDAAMARHNAMSHRLPGEAYFANRISKAGYHWRYAGENIGWNSRMSKAGVLQLERIMYKERAPYNGHRLNILDRHYRDVGIDVYLDKKHHKVWLTVDFGHK